MEFALVFIVLTLSNYWIAFYASKQGKAGKIALFLGILIDTLFLLYFKYANFFVPSAISLLEKLGIEIAPDGIQILIPIGLSFFVVQAISYLIDVNKGVTAPTTNIIHFALYMAYFPRVISGPIERSRNFFSILENKRKIDKVLASESFVLIIQGLVRKIIIANLLFYIMPYNVFSEPQKFTSPALLAWLVAYSFAIYNDFAGYTSIARGISGFFGIPLTENFKTPYLSRNFTEFWQRWHISLSTWLRDYIFMPITRYFRRRRSTLNDTFSIVIPPLATMLISALWHNVSYNMLIWGGLYGIYLVIERYITLRNPIKPGNAKMGWRQLPAIITVFLLVSFAWVPFRANPNAAFEYWGGLISPLHWINSLTNLALVKQQIANKYAVDIALLVGLSIILDIFHEQAGELGILRSPSPIKAILLNLAIFGLIIALMVMSVPPPFVYQGF